MVRPPCYVLLPARGLLLKPRQILLLRPRVGRGLCLEVVSDSHSDGKRALVGGGRVPPELQRLPRMIPLYVIHKISLLPVARTTVDALERFDA